MATARPVAMGVGAMRIAQVGDGVAGTDFKDLPLPTLGSVAFNFQDPKEVKIETEGADEPFYVEFVKDGTDYIEFSVPTPSNETIKTFMGGTIDKGTTESPKDIWSAPEIVPSIAYTFQCETLPKQGKKVIYTIVNGRIAAKLSQAPSKEQAELLLVRVYKQAAISAAGVVGKAFTREVVTV